MMFILLSLANPVTIWLAVAFTTALTATRPLARREN